MQPAKGNNHHRLKKAISNELAEIEKLVDELAELGLYPEIKAETVGGFSKNSSNACHLVGSLVSEYYKNLEQIARHIAKEINPDSPSRPQEEIDWFEQLADSQPGNNSALFKEEILGGIKNLKEFHRTFQAGYCSSLNPKQVYDNITLVTKIHPHIKNKLSQL